MKSIQVKSLPLKEVIQDISHELGINYREKCEEYYLALPDHIGEGNIRGINFESGLGILQYNCLFYEGIEIRFVVNEIHPLKFLYCIEGSLEHRFENEIKVHTIDRFKEAIVASKKHNGHVLRFKPGEKCIINSLEITRRRFLNKIQCEIPAMDKEIRNMLNDLDANNALYHSGAYSLSLTDIFNQMKNFDLNDPLRKIFLEGKAYQMLTTQLLQYRDDLKGADHKTLLRQSEIKLIEEAAKIIDNEIAHFDTIDKLASRVGLNVNKLQAGFQYLYRLTVNQYIQKVRLDMAKNLLISSSYNISEIAEIVGLSSKSYFTKIFKEKYNVKPLEFRKQYLRIREN